MPQIEAQLRETQEWGEEKKASFGADALKQLTRACVELAALQQSSEGQADPLARTTVRAPLNGIVEKIRVGQDYWARYPAWQQFSRNRTDRRYPFGGGSRSAK